MKIYNHLADVIAREESDKRIAPLFRALNASSVRTIPVFEIKNAAEDGPVEILIYDIIGKDPWTGEGLSAKDFVTQLSKLDGKRDLDLRVNSRGGYVDEGIAIYNRVKEWKGKTRAFVDGSAASIASVIIMGADEVHMPKSGEILIHDAWGFAIGNADEMRDLAGHLDRESDRIAQIYADRTGGTAEEFRALMRKTTVFTGETAKAIGLADVLTDQKSAYNLTTEDIEHFKAAAKEAHTQNGNPVPVTATASTLPAQAGNNPLATTTPVAATHTTKPIMEKSKLIAALALHGITVDAAATDEQLEAALKQLPKPAAAAQPDPDRDAFKVELAKMVQNRISSDLDALVLQKRMTPAQAAVELPKCIKNEDRLELLAQWPVINEPVESIPVAITGESPKDILTKFGKFDDAVKSWQRGNDSITREQIRDAAINKANFFTQNKARIMEVMNTNTIHTSLKRDVILQNAVIVDFARRVMQLDMFSTVFLNVPLIGTNKVQIPFFDLDASGSQVFAAVTGYNTIGDTVIDHREITIGTGATDGGRWYIGLGLSSEEFVRQPYLKVEQLARLKADKLASDIVADVLSVVTAANYGAAVKTESAAAFNSDDVIDVRLACKLWPLLGRSLFLDSAYDASLLKDPAFKAAYAAASDSAIKEGRLYPRVFGFDYVESPTIPDNGENLVGFAAFKSAILVAFAPVPPMEEVRNAGVSYKIVVHPESGIALEYRTWGDPTLDSAVHTIEASFGWAKGNGNALKRITSA